MAHLHSSRDLLLLRSILQFSRIQVQVQVPPSPSPRLTRSFSVPSRPLPAYPGHVPLTTVERAALAVGSAVTSLINPYRHDMVAALGEATAQPYFITRLRNSMLLSPTGRRILRDRPRITSQIVKLAELRKLPSNSVGRVYAEWLDREGVTPDTRDAVRYIDNEEESYVMQRYRECHDFYHAVTGLPVWVEGEIGLKAFEFANTGLPMTGLSLAAIIRLKSEQRRRMFEVYLPWAFNEGWKMKHGELLNVYWEEELETPVEDLRKRLGITPPPDLREARRRAREKKRMKTDARLIVEEGGNLSRDDTSTTK
jgi:ubiquinone biosynthesis protein COQ4